METAPQVDTVILLSGDGDFAVLLDKVRETYGVATQVYSVEALTANVRTNAAALGRPGALSVNYIDQSAASEMYADIF